jgi:hypothetical protein
VLTTHRDRTFGEKTVEVDVPPETPESPEALIEEARRRARKRRMWNLAAIVTVALGAAAVLAFTGGSGGTGKVRTTATKPRSTPRPSTKKSSEKPPPSRLAAWPSLVYTGPGVGVVGMSPPSSDQFAKPSSLYLSADLTHWRNVTPPGTQVASRLGTFPIFQHASFLSADVGWVTAFDPITEVVTIYRTGDGGRSPSQSRLRV